MASSKKSKAEKKSSNVESSKTASKASKPRTEGLKKKKEEMEKNKSKNKNKLSNGNDNARDDKVLIIPSSSTESLEELEKGRGIDNNGRTSGTKPNKGKRKQQVDEYAVEGKEDAKTDKFPMNRIRTIMRAEDPDLRVSEEAILVINRATVEFLEQLTREAYACSVQDRKKFLGYQRLSHVVSKKKSYDFLLDFVPEKLKADDASRQRNLGRDEEGQNM